MCVPNTSAQRQYLWDDLTAFSRVVNGPCLVVGDFNSFLFYDEKIGYEGVDVTPRSQFFNCVLECGLEDLKASGCVHSIISWTLRSLKQMRLVSWSKESQTIPSDHQLKKKYEG